ncbi:MAG TPA: cupin domain-containing protein [Pseudonocardia sp.]
MPLNDLPMSRELLLEADLPGTPVSRVEIRRITMAPNLAPGAHRHNGPVLGSIVAGAVRFQVGAGPEQVLRPGDVFHEPAGAPITHFDALEDGAVFLGYFPLEPGLQPEIEMLG